MRQILSTQTAVYDMGEGWRVDIVTTPETYEAWIYHKDYGVKNLLFGTSTDTRFNIFCDMIERNFEEYKQDYINDYMEGSKTE